PLARGVAEESDVMCRDLLDRVSAVRGDDDLAGLGIVGVRAQLFLQPRPQRAAPLGGKRLERRSPLARRPEVEEGGRLAVQPVGRPVRRDVAAVPPDRADLLAADRLPDLTASFDILAREERLAGGRDDGGRYRRRSPIDL